MITGFFIGIITTVVSFFVSLLPIYPIPTQWFDAINFIWGLVNSLNFLLPVSTLLTVLGIAMTIHVTIFVWHFSLKLYHMIRGR